MNDFLKKPIKRKTQIFKKKTTPLPTTIKPIITSGLCYFGFKPEPVIT